MYKRHHNSGYSLIEVLVAITILMLAIVAPMTIAIKSIESSRYTLEQNTAIFLAQEGISILEMVRNQIALENINAGNFDNDALYWNWTTELADCETVNGCNFDATDPVTLLDDPNNILECADAENCRLQYDEGWSQSMYRLTAEGSSEPSPFIRRVFIDSLDDHEMVVRVVVEWDSEFLGQLQQVSITSSIFKIYGI